MHLHPRRKRFPLFGHLGYRFAVLAESYVHFPEFLVLFFDFLFEREFTADVRTGQLVNGLAV